MMQQHVWAWRGTQRAHCWQWRVRSQGVCVLRGSGWEGGQSGYTQMWCGVGQGRCQAVCSRKLQR